MTPSSADTAELPLVRETRVPGPGPFAVATPAPTPAPAPALIPVAAPVAARAARRVERLHAIRERRLYAAIGITSIAAVFGAAVAVLDVLH